MKMRFPSPGRFPFSFRQFPRVLLLALFLYTSWSGKACDMADVQLDSIVAVGNEYDVYLTLCVGGGILATTLGADDMTTTFAFGFYSSTCSGLCISDFPPSVTGDSTGNTLMGVSVGPSSIGPSQTDATIAYFANSGPFTCITSTVQCGHPHQQCDQYRFRMNAIPDSIRVFGIEGAGNPLAGCTYNADMMIDLSNQSTGGVCCNDTIAPQISGCPVGDSIYLGQNCNFTLLDYDSVVTITDDCASSPLYDQLPFPGTQLGPGSQQVSIFATDCAGNRDTCQFTMTVLDTIPPVAICQNQIAYLAASGQVTVQASMVGASSTDNCGITGMTLSSSNFTCSDLGNTNVNLSVTDGSSNTATCTSTISVVDTVAPIAICQPITFYLDGNGMVTFPASALDGGSGDACGINTFFASTNAYGCANVGTNQIQLLVTDFNNNSSSCFTTATVLDTIPPTASCQGQTVSLDGLGVGTIVPGQLDDGSADNCATLNFSATPSTLTCADLGATPVILTVTDASGNSDTCQTGVFVEDAIPPIVTCPNDTTLTGASGSQGCGADVNFTPATATDNCGAPTLIPTAPPGSFFSVGISPVTYTATDSSGNSANCSFMVTVNPPAPVTAAFSFSQSGNLQYSFSNQSSSGASVVGWEFGDGNTSTLDNPVHTYAAGGTYTVCLTVADSCTQDTNCQTLLVTTAASPEAQTVVALYPNPNDGEFNIQWRGETIYPLTITILDALGREVYQKAGVTPVQGEPIRVSRQGLTSGNYQLRVEQEGQQWDLRLLIK